MKVISKRVKPNKRMGYCHNKMHKGFVTLKILKEHDCLGKGCFYLEKYNDHPMWNELESKKIRKKLIKYWKRNITCIKLEDFLSNILEFYCSYKYVPIDSNGKLVLDEFIKTYGYSISP